jgi:hypothetical protein
MISFNFKWIIACLAVLTTFSLSSCSKDESYDVKGDPSTIIYINIQNWSPVNTPKNTSSFTVYHTPVGELGKVKIQFPVLSTKPVDKAVTVTAGSVDTIVNQYNRTYGTSYTALPSGLLNISKSTATIEQEESISKDSIMISVDSAKLALLTDPTYIAAVQLISTSVSNNTISTDYKTVYVVINRITTNCYQSPILTDMVGALITPRTSWTATMNVIFTNAASRLFDNKTTTYILVSPAQACALTVDMASENTNITGIRLHSYSTSYLLYTVNVYSSSDGTNWTTQGSGVNLSTASPYQYIKFYSPITARYIKLEVTSYKSASYIVLSEFDVYKN